MLINLTEIRHAVKSFSLGIQFSKDFIVWVFLRVYMCHKTCDNWVKWVPIFRHMRQSFFLFLQFKKFLLENNAGFNLSIVYVSFFFCKVKLFAKKVKIKSTQRDMKSNNATMKITSQITIFFLKQQKSPLGLHDFTVSQITCTCKRNCSYWID